MTNIVYAIPSYNRVDGIQKHTLAVLARYGVDPASIYIFVNTAAQAAEYAALPKTLYGHIVATRQPKGIRNVRNFIVDYFPENQKVVSLDDDVQHVYELKRGKLRDIQTFSDLVARGFSLCAQHGYTLWGLYPTANPYYMTTAGEYTTTPRFIVGSFMAFINKKRHVTLNFKEDYELSARAAEEDGGVIRFNHIAIKHRLYAAGGIGQSQDTRLPANRTASRVLIRRYPHLFFANKRRDGEILFRTKKVMHRP